MNALECDGALLKWIAVLKMTFLKPGYFWLCWFLSLNHRGILLCVCASPPQSARCSNLCKLHGAQFTRAVMYPFPTGVWASKATEHGRENPPPHVWGILHLDCWSTCSDRLSAPAKSWNALVRAHILRRKRALEWWQVGSGIPISANPSLCIGIYRNDLRFGSKPTQSKLYPTVWQAPVLCIYTCNGKLEGPPSTQVIAGCFDDILCLAPF